MDEKRKWKEWRVSFFHENLPVKRVDCDNSIDKIVIEAEEEEGNEGEDWEEEIDFFEAEKEEEEEKEGRKEEKE